MNVSNAEEVKTINHPFPVPTTQQHEKEQDNNVNRKKGNPDKRELTLETFTSMFA